jgi:hypothetical protein
MEMNYPRNFGFNERCKGYGGITASLCSAVIPVVALCKGKTKHTQRGKIEKTFPSFEKEGCRDRRSGRCGWLANQKSNHLPQTSWSGYSSFEKEEKVMLRTNKIDYHSLIN